MRAIMWVLVASLAFCPTLWAETSPVSGTAAYTGTTPPLTATLTYDPVTGLVQIACSGSATIKTVRRSGGGTGTVTDITASDTNSNADVYRVLDTYLQGDGTSTVAYELTWEVGSVCYRVTFSIVPDGAGSPPSSATQVAAGTPVVVPCP